jgi:hypothetical protein
MRENTRSSEFNHANGVIGVRLKLIEQRFKSGLSQQYFRRLSVAKLAIFLYVSRIRGHVGLNFIVQGFH